jgi:hypothetical protein
MKKRRRRPARDAAQVLRGRHSSISFSVRFQSPRTKAGPRKIRFQNRPEPETEVTQTLLRKRATTYSFFATSLTKQGNAFHTRKRTGSGAAVPYALNKEPFRIFMINP